MKCFLTLILAFSSAVLFAQPVVMSRIKADSLGLPKKQLSDYATRTGVMLETPFSVQARMKSAVQSALSLDRMTDLNLWCSIYLNAEGRVDYVLYEFMPVAGEGSMKPATGTDSLSRVLEAKLPAFLNEVISSRNAGSKSIYRTFSDVQAFPSGVKKDSTVFGLASALAAQDTLKVSKLHLSRSLLAEVPNVIYRFPNLQMLMLDDNDLKSASINMKRLPKLRHIDLSRNVLDSKEVRISKNTSLKWLNLQKNGMHDIPAAVQSCKSLQTLWLGYNPADRLSNKSFRKLKKLRDLNLYRADIAVLPKGIKKLRNLEVLDLYYNKLESLPASIVNLKKLTHLAISHNQLKELPERIDKLASVHTLYAHHNRLSKLPPSIVNMQNLKILDLGFNWFTTFPSELTSFVRLSELDLSSNNFPEFPEQLLKIQNLGKLYLRGNPFLQKDSEDKYSRQLGQLKSRHIEVFY